MFKINRTTSILLLVAFTTFTSCFSIKTGGTRPGNKLYETFYAGEDGMQYFIRELTFVSDVASNEILNTDFTFRYVESINSSVTLNVSLINNKEFQRVDSLKFIIDSISISTTNLKTLFKEKQKKKFIIRYSSKMNLSELSSIMKSECLSIHVYENGNSHCFIPTKKTRKSINTMSQNVFIVFEGLVAL